MPISTRAVVSEFIGTLSLVCVVVGSGVMGSTLSSDAGIALIINAISTILALALLISVLGPVSGAHFNPIVTLIAALRRQLSAPATIGYVTAQVLGAIGGSLLANAMFDQPVVQISDHHRVSNGTLIGEVIATAGLVIVIGVFATRGLERQIPIAVAAWIGSAYFFTSSTSFANPAVTVGRVFTNTFAGSAPSSVLPFIAAQIVGASLGLLAVRGITND